ncbi:Lactonase, 7-bladed beta-propeller-domain-containing protein [Biscogniauxia mediterranea]|nr:Lactonase, 7-bladed beta-propeller-domain-containing protein [Biscogniauxia mediterranea]
MGCLQILLALVLASINASRVEAAKHSLIVGTFSTNFLYTVEYDDDNEALSLVAKSEVPAASSWISLNNDATKLYGTDWNAEEPSFVSYDVSDPRHIKHEATIVAGRGCAGSKSVFVAARRTAPYTVYGSYYYGDDARCGTVLSVDGGGALNGIVQNYTYAAGSAVHGTAFSPDERVLFSADAAGNAIWTHAVDAASGAVVSPPLGRVAGPSAGSRPRHLAVHGSGRYVYAVLEGTSQVAQYAVSETGDGGMLSFIHGAAVSLFPLLREGSADADSAADFWADEVALSAAGRYLWATNRARDRGRRGYVSAFALEPSGAVVRQLFLRPTSTSGGFANSVAPSRFDDAVAALTDNATGLVQIWHVERGLVASLDIEDGGGCCANAVWLD